MRSARSVDFPQLPQRWLEAAIEALPGLARDITVQIRAEVPEYAGDRAGEIDSNVRDAVRAALQAFVNGLSGQRDQQYVEVFRRLGRLEAESGRSHDTLQMAYRVATHQVAEFLALIAQQVNAPPDQHAKVRHAAISFVEQLASLSRAGYDDADLAGAAHSQAVSRLLDTLLAPGEAVRSKIVSRARAVGWAVPERVCALEFVPDGAFRPAVLRALAEKVGQRLLVGRLPGRCIGFLAIGSDDSGIAGSGHGDPALDDLAAGLPAGATAVIGPVMQVLDAARSARIAYRFVHRSAAVALPAGLVDCDDHLLSLFGSEASDVMVALAQSRLQPLAALGVLKRVKAAHVLSAMLEYGGLPRDAPDLADISPSTRQYRKAMIEDMFGPALRDRDRRVELILALRTVMPQWEAELAMHERRSAAKRSRRADSPKPPAGSGQKPVPAKSGARELASST